jgi:hypothetical protein
MSKPSLDQTWQTLSQELTTGMAHWRLAHPSTSLRQMETELDSRLSRLRARMLEDMALSSAAADWDQAAPTTVPLCPQCATPLERRGKQTRHLQTHGGHDLALERSYGVCPSCQEGLFPPR